MDENLMIDKINHQKEYLSTNALSHYKNRIKALKKLKQNILLMEEEIYDALKQDLNKSKEESYALLSASLYARL